LQRTLPDSVDSGFRQVGEILRLHRPGFLVSKRRLRQSGTICSVRQKCEAETQNLGFSSRPFVLCGLPVKRPASGCLLHERRNGQFVLQVTGHPSYGLPWGQDRLIPIFLSTLLIRQQSPRITFSSGRKCWILSGCSRAVRNTADSSGLCVSSARRSFLVQTRSESTLLSSIEVVQFHDGSPNLVFARS
jgi:hypothetical protein